MGAKEQKIVGGAKDDITNKAVSFCDSISFGAVCMQ